MTVRFFIYDDDAETEENSIIEVDEFTFLDASGSIEYERNTVFDNGVSQICLTKYNHG